MARILVVDDSVFARFNISKMLQDAGHEVLEAGDGRAGLEIVLAQNPACIISDLLMPEMDGISFLAALRAQDISLPVIVVTADIQETKRQQCLSLGAAGFINKPPQKGELQRVVEAVLLAAGGSDAVTD